MDKINLKKIKRAEAKFFDNLANLRTRKKHIIAQEVDIRRATKYIPKKNEKNSFLIDPKMTNKLGGNARDRYIRELSTKPGAKILDIGCGSGWLALELARHGCHVEAYDLSPKAIELAKKTLKENPFKKGFGSVTYHLQDISIMDLGVEKYDGVSGWSAFHHMPNVPLFMDRVHKALKPGGIVASMDDMPRGKLEQCLEYIFEFILPTYNLSYLQKIKFVLNLITGKSKLRKEVFSPMEKAKHSNVFEISEAFGNKFNVIYTIQENAFVGTPVMRITGPDWFRYFLASLAISIDRLLCKLQIVKGFERIMVAKKID